MRAQRGTLNTIAATIVTLALAAGCGSGSSAPAETPAGGDPEATATEGTVPPPAEQDDASADQAPAGPTASATAARPSGSGVTPSPTIGGAAAPSPADAPAGAASGAPATPAEREQPAPVRDTPPVARLVELPAGTILPLRLTTSVGSNTSAVEDPVTARVTRDVEVGGDVVVPEGSTVSGRVTHAQDSGRVKGRAGLTVRFYTLTVGERTYDIDAEPVRREAQGTKGKDAQKIGIGAGAGAVVGGLLGGRKGAAIGAVAGGAGGTGVVLATKGQEVQLPAGTAVDLRLASATTLTRQ